MTDPRLEDHLTRHLGIGVLDTRVGDVEIWRHERPEFVSFATHGLSAVPILAICPQELVASVRHGQDGAARYLVQLTLELVIGNDRGVVNNEIIPNGQPLLARTDISGILVGPHPYLEESFEAIFDDNRRAVAEMMTLIPLATPEIAHADSRGVDALIDLLEDTNPPLLDVTRSSN
ncbi:suppressor of fused protein SUFU [Amycolatopsis echigonensis]|uniref:Suppressor of fused protein SUFU n=1 Tax=Amycolatopsis echigonensis TaxID=2576905 RepID=A0A2N3WFE5_9PSEU|nr:suppressor of fused domain protein [Amycolatopsis niigatensis]PKV92602.1 suppressor of fused protein SUFU [Amycolatopsis niigatensis]